MISFFDSFDQIDYTFKMLDTDFEKFHPKELRWSNEEKEEFFEVEGGRGLWMEIDGHLIGEILWNKEKINQKGQKIAYIFGITIIKKYQGKGYSKIFKMILYNVLKNAGYTEVRGHARDGRSWETTKKLGGKLIKTIENYEETGEKYHFYKQKL